ncbi:hypothetical protein ABXS75_08185 [Roseburia hominis]
MECARIILKYAPEAQFCSLRIFEDTTLKANCIQLVSALEWCLVNNIPIVNMSLGSHKMCDYSKIQRIIAKMIARRQIIVAAHNIRAFYSVPACVGGVLGVYADERMQDCQYKYCGCLPEFHYIAASAKHSFLPQYPEIFTPITNSYAAPTITAIVHNFLKKYNLFQVPVFEIHNYLLQKGNSIPLQKPDFLASANILNLSKYSILAEVR